MSSKIFEEAIADAKKLREVAENNAKKVILESVTPKIREFIENQLLEKDDDYTDEGTLIGNPSKNSNEEIDLEGLDDDIVLDESSMSALIEMLGGNDKIGPVANSNKKVNYALKESVKAAISSLNESQRKKIIKIANKINNSKDNLASNQINNIIKNKEKSSMSNRNFYEVDLKALREALEEEVGLDHDDSMEFEDEEPMDGEAMEFEEDDMDEGLYEDDDMEDMEEEYDDEDVEDMLNELSLKLDLGEEIEEDQLPEELRAYLEEDEEDEEDEDDEDLEDMEDEEEEDMEDMEPPEGLEGMDFGFEDEPEKPGKKEESYYVDAKMLKEELKRIKKMVREGNMDHHFGGKGSSKAGVKNSFGGSGKKNHGYKGAFGGGSYGQDAFANPPQLNKLNEAIRKLRRNNRAQSEKLMKYRRAVETLREQLEDLNLFNAKLLYVNKLLQNKSLNESEKKSIIKALDESKSLSEAKTLYKSLTETFGRNTKGKLNESRRYGRSSRTTTSSSTKGRASGELDRWQILAGLK